MHNLKQQTKERRLSCSSHSVNDIDRDLGETVSLISQPCLVFVICCCPALLHSPLLSLDLPDTSDQSLTREDGWAAARRKTVESVCLRLQRSMCWTCGSLTPFRSSGLWCQSLCCVCEVPLLLEETSQIIFTLVWDLQMALSSFLSHLLAKQRCVDVKHVHVLCV